MNNMKRLFLILLLASSVLLPVVAAETTAPVKAEDAVSPQSGAINILEPVKKESTLKEYFSILFGLVFVQNFVLSQFLGLCPFIGVSKKRDAAIGMGMAVIFVMVLACIVTMVVYKGIFLAGFWMDGNGALSETGKKIADLHMAEFLDIVAFILIIASLVQFVEIVMKKVAPALYKTLGIYLPLITTNCAILGATQMKLKIFSELSFAEALFKNALLGIAGGVGFTLALFLMAGIRERLETAPIPKCMQGVPIAFIAGSGMALAFFGFAGIV